MMLPAANAFWIALLIWALTVVFASAWLCARWIVERSVEVYTGRCQCDRCQAAREPQDFASAHEIARDLVRRRHDVHRENGVVVGLDRHNLN